MMNEKREDSWMNQQQINQKLDQVMYRLMHLDEPDLAANENVSSEDRKKGMYARDFGIKEWDWPQGVGLFGLLQLQKARGNLNYDAFLRDWVRDNLAIGLPSANINTTAPFLTLFELTERYEEPVWEELCRERAAFLMQGLPRTQDNGFEHVTSHSSDRNDVMRNPQQLWADTLFMAVLFLGKMGVRYDRRDWLDEAVYQYLLHIRYLQDTHTGFLYHGWTFEGRNNFGGIFWNRGNAWFTYGALAFLEAVKGKIPASSALFIENAWKAQASALLGVQDPTGLWHTILTDPDSYLEASGSGEITAGLIKGIRMGLLSESARPAVERAVNALMDAVDETGTVQHVSAGTGMGMDAQHYKDIMIRPMAYGQSLTALALTEALYL